MRWKWIWCWNFLGAFLRGQIKTIFDPIYPELVQTELDDPWLDLGGES